MTLNDLINNLQDDIFKDKILNLVFEIYSKKKLVVKIKDNKAIVYLDKEIDVIMEKLNKMSDAESKLNYLDYELNALKKDDKSNLIKTTRNDKNILIPYDNLSTKLQSADFENGIYCIENEYQRIILSKMLTPKELRLIGILALEYLHIKKDSFIPITTLTKKFYDTDRKVQAREIKEVSNMLDSILETKIKVESKTDKALFKKEKKGIKKITDQVVSFYKVEDMNDKEYVVIRDIHVILKLAIFNNRYDIVEDLRHCINSYNNDIESMITFIRGKILNIQMSNNIILDTMLDTLNIKRDVNKRYLKKLINAVDIIKSNDKCITDIYIANVDNKKIDVNKAKKKDFYKIIFVRDDKKIKEEKSKKYNY